MCGQQGKTGQLACAMSENRVLSPPARVASSAHSQEHLRRAGTRQAASSSMFSAKGSRKPRAFTARRSPPVISLRQLAMPGSGRPPTRRILVDALHKYKCQHNPQQSSPCQTTMMCPRCAQSVLPSNQCMDMHLRQHIHQQNLHVRRRRCAPVHKAPCPATNAWTCT